MENKDTHLDEKDTAVEASNEEVSAEETTVESTEETESNASAEALESVQAELQKKEDDYLRLQAELANVQKRNRQERETDAKYRSQSLAKELIVVIDNLERALDIETTEENTSLKKGIEMAYESFIQALKNEGIQVVNPLNEAFDPNYHQAVQTVPLEEGQVDGTVVTVHQKGYTLHERVLRPAMVAVAQQ